MGLKWAASRSRRLERKIPLVKTDTLVMKRLGVAADPEKEDLRMT
jgi:hypothetical protein